MGGFPRRDVCGTPTPSSKRRQKFSTNTNWLNLAGTFLAVLSTYCILNLVVGRKILLHIMSD
jgi:hypothetical protein